MIISEIFFHQPLIYQLDLKWAQGGGRNPVYCLTTWDESSCVRILNPKPEIHLYACPPFYALPERIKSRGDRRKCSPLLTTLHRRPYKAL